MAEQTKRETSKDKPKSGTLNKSEKSVSATKTTASKTKATNNKVEKAENDLKVEETNVALPVSNLNDNNLETEKEINAIKEVNLETAEPANSPEKVEEEKVLGVNNNANNGEMVPENVGENANLEGEVSQAPVKRKKTGWEIATLAISIALCVIMLPILLVNVVLIFKAAIKPNDIPSIFGYKPLIVLTDSMYPDIKSGDLIFSKIVEPETLKVGDVITFREKSGGIVTHKILAILEDDDGVPYFQTYGINNYARNDDGTPRLNEQGEKIITPDTENIYFNQVEGKYVSRMAGMGNFIYWMQSVWGLIICIGIPVIAFIVYEFVRRNAEMKAQKATANNATNELEELRKKLAEMEKDKDNKQ